MKSEGGAL